MNEGKTWDGNYLIYKKKRMTQTEGGTAHSRKKLVRVSLAGLKRANVYEGLESIPDEVFFLSTEVHHGGVQAPGHNGGHSYRRSFNVTQWVVSCLLFLSHLEAKGSANAPPDGAAELLCLFYVPREWLGRLSGLLQHLFRRKRYFKVLDGGRSP
jgi:hypothetical protein